ncbi:MAG TPA: hypothetical protein VGF92_05380 [Stellaceae bacterium]|jgi:hypothetical protein
MRELANHRAWRIGMHGYKITVHPVHAFPFIEQRDIELQQRGADWWCVAVWRLESAEPITLDHWARLDRERLALQLYDCAYLREHHPIVDMRAVYDHCATWMEHEIRRRAA